MKYLLLYGKLTSKKPKFYCAYHKCGINGGCKKKKMRRVQAFQAYDGENSDKYSCQDIARKEYSYKSEIL